ncbi:hypothetical protein PMZ80_001143 [Knufia obscura]|uniref:Uncharacterized protein n=1 Tax=Knufia obscura TaxID=1635080 RepID=A0ABR0S2B8_9EURO|nr:hypothetical protein PMZ80_001143 [Knufia obscura]
MGLPFYRNPDDVDAENAAAKLDRAAAQRRSAIRREPSIRPGREHSSSSGLTNIIRNRHDLSTRQARIRANYERQEADAQIAILEAELERLRRQRLRTSSRIQEERAQRRLERQIENDLNSGPPSPVPNDVYLTTNENELTPHDSGTADQILLPRPTRESNLRFEVAADTTRPTSPQQQTSFMPSPPHSSTDASRNRPVDGPLDTWETTPPLTQDFAPARAARAARGGSRSPTVATHEVARAATENDRHGLETPPPESWENSYPPLRRVPHMSPRPLPRTTVDGLGDRHRSPSPLSETPAPEEENWNTLLTGLDHSDSAPSTSTSFASMTDLLSASRSSSHRSSNTQLTSTSFGEIGTSTDDTCDLPPGITEDDVRRIRDRHQRTAGHVTAPRSRIPESIRSGAGNGANSPQDSPMSILLHEAREARASRERQRGDELLMLQAIAERQQSHEQVPDEWWALAGLPPGLARQQNDS